MAGKWMQGRFKPTNIDKYAGDVEKIVFRSSWENSFMNWADKTPEVLRWSSEQTTIPYFDPVTNKSRRYFVDFKMLLRKADGTNKIVLVEIKPYKQTIKPKNNKRKSEKTFLTEQTTWLTNMAKWNAAKEVCARMGWEFIIITENELYGGIDKGYKPPARTG